MALGLPPDRFTRHLDGSRAVLNVNRYPALGSIGPARAGQFRVGPHTDFGVPTILDREPGFGGLQIRRPTAPKSTHRTSRAP